MDNAKIIVSSCLLGERTRFDGKQRFYENVILKRWLDEGRIISFCPEVKAGLPVPRPPAEIVNSDGNNVINGAAKVKNINGKDVTNYFIDGAQKALFIARENDVKIAILKDGSPSCGKSYIYDGSFSGNKKLSKGVTATLLEQNCIYVFNEHEINEASERLKRLETSTTKSFAKPI